MVADNGRWSWKPLSLSWYHVIAIHVIFTDFPRHSCCIPFLLYHSMTSNEITAEATRWKKEYERVKEERNNFLEELSRVQKELAEAHSRLAELTIKNNVLFCENSDLKASLEGRIHEKVWFRRVLLVHLPDFVT